MPLLAGLALLGWGLRRYRLYHFEAAEVLLISAIVLIVAGLGIAGATLHCLHAREGRVKT
jgi:hypothetical protein